MRVWLDDVRPMPEGFDYWAKNAYNVIGLLITNNVTFISFDHDLGEFSETGYWLAKFIEIRAFDGSCNRIEWDIHSANPVGRRNIEMAMKSAERFWSM